MEVCRKCKQIIKSDDLYVNTLASLTLGFFGKGKYHLSCWKKSKRNGIFVFIIITIMMFSWIIAITASILHQG